MGVLSNRVWQCVTALHGHGGMRAIAGLCVLTLHGCVLWPCVVSCSGLRMMKHGEGDSRLSVTYSVKGEGDTGSPSGSVG